MELSKLDRNVFDMQIDDLSVFIRVNITDEELDKYYNRYKHLTNSRFAEVVEYIKNNHEYPGSFPLPNEFNIAIRLTARENSFIPATRDIEDTEEFKKEYKKDLQKLIKKYPAIGEKKEKLPNPAAYEIKMIKEGKIYSVKLGKWVLKSLRNNIGGDFYEPKTPNNEIESIGEIID